MEERAKMRPNPTRVAMDELQLQDLQKAEAAVPPDCERGWYYGIE